MPKSKGSRPGSSAARPPFPTIDEALAKAQELTTILTRLGEYKHPLDIRKGSAMTKTRKEVEQLMASDENSIQLKAGGHYYFLDVGKTKDGKPYLRITESRGKGKERSSINVFPEHAAEFAQAVATMAGRLEPKEA